MIYTAEILGGIEAIPAASWNRLALAGPPSVANSAAGPAGNPFLLHEFFAALEASGSGDDSAGCTWPYVGEMFADAAGWPSGGVAPHLSALRPQYDAETARTFALARLVAPKSDFAHSGGRSGRHSEHLSRMLAQMQVLQRAHPDAVW